MTYPNIKFSKLIVSFWYEVFLGVTRLWAEITVYNKALLPFVKSTLHSTKSAFRQTPKFRVGGEQSNMGQLL